MNNPRSERLLFPGPSGSGARFARPSPQRVATGSQLASSSADSFVENESLFLSNLPVIDSVTAYVCRRHHLAPAEADDFRSEVRLHFIDRNYEALQRFQARSSLRTYLSVVIQRLFLDYRNRLWGKWRPSVEATRLGPTAILVERLVVRDGWTLDHVAEMLRTNHGVALDGPLYVFGARLSQRPPARQFVAESEAGAVVSTTGAPDANVLRAEQDFLAKRVRAALRRARQALAPELGLILRMRFDDGMPVADIARALHLNQKRLYRTIEGLLADLCTALEGEGISRADIRALFAEDHLNEGAGEEEQNEPAAAPESAAAEQTRTPWPQKR